MIEWIQNFIRNYSNGMYFPHIQIKDIIEILIVTIIVYEIMLWIKNTKAWKNLFSNINPFDKNKENQRFSDETLDSIVRACYAMGSVCTGALIVVEQVIQLTEYEMTGIELDCKVSSQVLINIFEHNTPLHDGAVIIRGDRITSATCYLPLSDNMTISKDLGTRHRAALGMSEVCDALVIVVSEETGLVSVASGGRLLRAINAEELRSQLSQIQYRKTETKNKFSIRKGWHRS